MSPFSSSKMPFLLFRVHRSLLLWVCLGLSLGCFVWSLATNKSDVDYAVVASKCSNATAQFSVATPDHFSFPFLVANSVRSPFSFTLSFGPKELTAGERSMWVLCGQGPNHGQILVEHQGWRFGMVDNRVSQESPSPGLRLAKVGEVSISGEADNFRFIGFNNELEAHNAELGLVIFSPREMSSEQLVKALSSRNRGVDTVLLLVFLASTFCLALLVVPRSANKFHPRDYAIWGALLLYTLAFPVIGQREVPPAPLAEVGTQSPRSGVEGAIADGLTKGVKSLRACALKALPSRQQDDQVPDRLKQSKGLLPTEIYATRENIVPMVSSHIFNGKLSQIQALPAETFLQWEHWLLVAIGAAIIVDGLVASSWSLVAALALISAFSIFLSIRLSAGWDEFFINLRHAYMLVNHGVYSINAKTMIEATVDFIPLLATAFLGFLGMDLINAFLCLSLLGNIGVVIFAFLLAHKVTGNRSWALIAALALGMYPNVLWVGGTGFTAVLFSAWMLGAIYFLVFQGNRPAGLFFLSTLTLVRTEGFLFSMALLAYVDIVLPWPDWIRGRVWREKVLRPLLRDGVIVAMPFLISLGARKLAFGHPIPNPIAFKNSHMDNAFFCAGLDRLAEMVSMHDFGILAVLCGLLGLAAWWTGRDQPDWERRKSHLLRLLALNALMFVVILPYYTGGGDWFPPRWNRYGLPCNLFLALTGMILLVEAFPKRLGTWRRLTALAVFSLAFTIGYLKSCKFRQDNFVNLAKTGLTFPRAGFEHWERVDQLAALGTLLRETLPADAVVASPEEATIMYFSQREMLGMLGVSNPEMVSMPFQPLEPGEIGHRKRAYLSVNRNRPDVIALYEPALYADLAGDALTLPRVHAYLQMGMFNQKMVDIGYYRTGSYEAVQKMGYRHFTICYSNQMFSIFVGQKVREAFLQALQAKGFTKLGDDSIEYSVSPDLSRKYAPAAPEIMSTMGNNQTPTLSN